MTASEPDNQKNQFDNMRAARAYGHSYFRQESDNPTQTKEPVELRGRDA